MIIIVSGTPGTGKTKLAKELASAFHMKYVNMNKIAKSVSEGYDKQRQCQVIDTKKLNKEMIQLINLSNESMILDSHLSHYLPKKYVDLCIISKCDITKLRKRLKMRKYSPEKIKENCDCEIFDVCLNEAKDRGHAVMVVEMNFIKDIKSGIKLVKQKLDTLFGTKEAKK